MLGAVDRLPKPSYFLMVGAIALAASTFVFLFGSPVEGFRLWQWSLLGIAGVVFLIHALIALARRK
jgi:hypothetical protein